MGRRPNGLAAVTRVCTTLGVAVVKLLMWALLSGLLVYGMLSLYEHMWG
jgi:hypothetical protein